MTSMEITKLVGLCRQGDSAALGELYNTYVKQIRGVCKHYLSDKQTVNDAVHDSFVAIFTSLDSLRDDSKFEAWMMAITRNVAKDYLKANQTIPLEEIAKNKILDTTTQEKVEAELFLSEIASLIGKLPDGYGKIFRLAVFEGLSHKEIAARLGIEPHSSSSQLARAKKMLRSLMQNSWLVLLLLLVPVAILFLRKENPVADEENSVATTQDETQHTVPTDQLQEPVIAPQPTMRNGIPARKLQLTVEQKNESAISDTATDMIAQEVTKSDSLLDNNGRGSIQFIPKIETPYYNRADFSHNKSIIGGDKTRRWSIRFMYAGSYDEQNANTTIINEVEVEDEAHGYAPFHGGREEIVSGGEEFPCGGDESHTLINDTVLYTNYHYMPATLTLLAHYTQSKRLGIETGVSYMRLVSDFEKDTNKTVTRGHLQTIHYLGIPIKGIYNLVTIKGWNLYGNLGATMGIPIHSQFNTSGFPQDTTNIHVPLLWSFSTGLGLQYNITPHIGIFAEPSIQYYLPSHGDLETYCTEHPYTFSLPLGIKISW